MRWWARMQSSRKNSPRIRPEVLINTGQEGVGDTRPRRGLPVAALLGARGRLEELGVAELPIESVEREGGKRKARG